MKKVKLYLDTHNVETGTFPSEITTTQFGDFYQHYKQACAEEGVVPLQIYTGIEAGKAFCLTLAESEAAVERAHSRAGLDFDSITEVKTVTPGDLFFTAAE